MFGVVYTRMSYIEVVYTLPAKKKRSSIYMMGGLRSMPIEKSVYIDSAFSAWYILVFSSGINPRKKSGMNCFFLFELHTFLKWYILVFCSGINCFSYLGYIPFSK